MMEGWVVVWYNWPMKFRALQWNIQAARTLDAGKDPKESGSYSGDDPEYFAKIIKSYNPDFVTFQELHENSQTSQLEEIANLAGLKYFVSDVYDKESFMDSSYSMSQGIASKIKLSNHKYINVDYPEFTDVGEDGTKYTSRGFGITYAEIQIEGQQVSIATSHVVPTRFFGVDESSEEAKPLRDALDSTTYRLGEKWITQGDFNFRDASLMGFLPKTLEQKGVEEIVQTEPTCPKGESLDHVMTRNVEVVDSKVDSSVLADHYLLITDFEV